MLITGVRTLEVLCKHDWLKYPFQSTTGQQRCPGLMVARGTSKGGCCMPDSRGLHARRIR